MDDIKESVRVAAGKAVNALSRTCIRMCDSAQSGVKASEETVQIILPPILDKGKGYSSTWVEDSTQAMLQGCMKCTHLLAKFFRILLRLVM